MTRISRILSFVLIAGSAAVSAGADRPNIVLIYADDLGYGDVGFNGRKSWETPNLDRLARQGTVFRRFYTAAVVCAPSRAAMLTGKSTIHCGVSRNNEDLPATETTIAEALKSRGYATALFGKWHHGVPKIKGADYVHPMDQGFDEFFGFTDAVHAWEKFPTTLWKGREKVPVTGHADDLFADRGIDFIERHRAGPFFLYLPFISAHFNIEAPEDEVARHKAKFPEKDPNRPHNATYAAMVTRFDRNVGRVVDAIDRLGLAENTLIVFTSDHGATFESGNEGTSDFHDSNAPLRGGKRYVWEGGIRVPACVRWTNHVPAGLVRDDVTSTLDLFPTFLAAANHGMPVGEYRGDGENQFSGWTTDPRLPGSAPAGSARTLFWEWRSEGGNQLAAMKGDLKLVITSGGKPELFDVKADPAERRNIAAREPERVRQLSQELKAWLATEIQP